MVLPLRAGVSRRRARELAAWDVGQLIARHLVMMHTPPTCFFQTIAPLNGLPSWFLQDAAKHMDEGTEDQVAKRVKERTVGIGTTS